MARVFCFIISLVFFTVPNFVSPASTYASLMPGGSPTGLSGAHNKNTRSMQHVDKKFKQGKLIYKGMDKKIGKQKWCLKVEGELVKLNIFNLWKTYKLFRGVTTDYFVDSFYVCDRPENTAYELIGKQNMQRVVYYLDRRFKLYLTERSTAYLYKKGQ